MAAKKRGRQAVRDADRRLIPAWIWITLGLVMGLGLALFLSIAGLMPGKRGLTDEPRPRVDESAPTEEIAAEGEAEWRPQYDFYTVLPEMEVVVPEGALKAPRGSEKAPATGPFVIQVGSFKDAEDAERIKAQLAFLGLVAHVKSVEIDRNTWHRVRLGPFTSRRETDQIRGRLIDNEYDAIVLTEKS